MARDTKGYVQEEEHPCYRLIYNPIITTISAILILTIVFLERGIRSCPNIKNYIK